jgi:hypothetical protein
MEAMPKIENSATLRQLRAEGCCSLADSGSLVEGNSGSLVKRSGGWLLDAGADIPRKRPTRNFRLGKHLVIVPCVWLS